MFGLAVLLVMTGTHRSGGEESLPQTEEGENAQNSFLEVSILKDKWELVSWRRKEYLLKFFLLQAINSSVQTGIIKKGNILARVPERSRGFGLQA